MQVRHWRVLGASLAAGVALMTGAVVAFGQATDVRMTSLTYQPQTLTVPVGTTVTWTNSDGMVHTVTADDGSFDSGSLADGDTYAVTFNAPGTYGYYCVPHGAPGSGMWGRIVVTDSGG
jgi:plastocyanin